MKPKTIATALLLGFVALSIGAMVVKEVRAREPVAAPLAKEIATPAPRQVQEGSRVVAYYFHGNVRCPTCISIETQSHAAVAEFFRDQIDAGRLEWRLVNYDAPENAHFRDDFQLAFQSVVLVEESGGKVVRWKNLADVWTWIHETPQEFEQYVVESTADFIAGGGT